MVAAAAPTTTDAVGSTGGWKEYKDQRGKTYFYNVGTKQSTWTMPPELRAAKMRAEAEAMQRKIQGHLAGGDEDEAKYEAEKAQAAKAALSAQAASSPPASIPGMRVERKTYDNKEEAREAFMALLADKNVGATWSWDMTMRAIVADERYGAMKTNSEKKACLGEYQQQRLKKQREEKKELEKRKRESFIDMLKEQPAGKIDSTTKFQEAFRQLGVDPRWRAIMDKRDQENLYSDHMKELAENEREQQRTERKNKMDACTQLLQIHESISGDTLWKDAKELMKDEEEWKALDNLDQLHVFETYVRDMEREEDNQKREERTAEKRKARKCRDAFKEVLARGEKEGWLHCRSLWHEVFSEVSKLIHI